MKRALSAAALIAVAVTASAARAEISTDAARAAVAPFYKALNAL